MRLILIFFGHLWLSLSDFTARLNFRNRIEDRARLSATTTVAAVSTGRRRRQANPRDTGAKAEYEYDAIGPKDADQYKVAGSTDKKVQKATDDGFDALDKNSFEPARNDGSLPPAETTTAETTTTTVTTTTTSTAETTTTTAVTTKTTTTAVTTTTTTVVTTTTVPTTTTIKGRVLKFEYYSFSLVFLKRNDFLIAYVEKISISMKRLKMRFG